MIHLISLNDNLSVKNYLDLIFLFINKMKNIGQDDIFNSIAKHFRNNRHYVKYF